MKYYKQEKEWSCGAACMRMVLEAVGIKKTEKELCMLLGTNQVKGTSNKSFPALAEKYKLNYLVKRDASIEDLKRAQKKYFVIINYFYPDDKVNHYSILKKIGRKKIYFLDPWAGPNHSYLLDHFKKLWNVLSKNERERRWFFSVQI